MSTNTEVELELIEEYRINDEHRFKLKVKGTNIIFNVAADDLGEAVNKVIKMMKDLKML